MQATTKRDFRTADNAYYGIDDETTYFVLAVSKDWLQLINQLGEPVFYPHEVFADIGGTVPAGWRFRIVRDDEGDDYKLGSPVLDISNFCSDLWCSDGDRAAEVANQKALERVLVDAATSVAPSERALLESALASYRRWLVTRDEMYARRMQ